MRAHTALEMVAVPVAVYPSVDYSSNVRSSSSTLSTFLTKPSLPMLLSQLLQLQVPGWKMRSSLLPFRCPPLVPSALVTGVTL